jgi:Xaa-Pro dipeptidase
MIVSVEPNIFIASEGLGARIIDNVLITANGAELLSTTSRDLRVLR